MPSLSLEESRRRADQLTVGSYDVTLDLTGDEKTYTSSTTIAFAATTSGETFLDVKPRELRTVHLDGMPLDVHAMTDGRLPLDLREGEHELVVEAVMGYRNDGEGLHRAVDPADGKHYTYAMSFLDAAPSIFACFDQPDLKAPYTFHVRTPGDWVVVGNSPSSQVEPGAWELETTKPLSTYFVTLVAGPYHLVRSEHDGIPLGLSCRMSLANDLDKDADELFTVTGQCFDEFHRLFGIRYPFGDYHQAFVPEFNAGAMENPGCVTFRDPMIFTSKVTESERTFRAMVIGHEMAHQWFGDMVTPRWWDDLWLNESFANYMGLRVTQDATAFDAAWLLHSFGHKRHGIEADGRRSTHPVAGNGATDASSALQDFDGISYEKGTAVLAQLNRSVGDEIFFAGVRRHIERNRFGNATLQDLLECWTGAGAGDLSQWVDQWLRTPGLDRLSVDRSGALPALVRTVSDRHPADRSHALSVARFTGDGWVVEPAQVGATPLPLSPEAVDQPVVLDPHDDTWAVLGIDALAVPRLGELLPRMDDPTMRATTWNAIRDGVADATLAPATALDIVVAAIPREDQDLAVHEVTRFALTTLAATLMDDHRGAEARLHRAVRDRLETANPGSGLQVAAVRGAVASAGAELLRSWLAGSGVPDGVEVDLDLRWRMLTRLAVLGSVDRAELDAALAQDPTADAAVHRVRALASLPDEEAKRLAWDHFTGAAGGTNYEIEAAGEGMWLRGHEHLTASYVDRYFADLPGLAEVHSGWLLQLTANVFFPGLAVSAETVSSAETVLALPGLNLTLRRVLSDRTDDLVRAVRVREVFGG